MILSIWFIVDDPGKRGLPGEREREGGRIHYHSLWPLTSYHLCQDAPNGPHVHSGGVELSTQQYLRSSVPSGGHIVSHGWQAEVRVRGRREGERAS